MKRESLSVGDVLKCTNGYWHIIHDITPDRITIKNLVLPPEVEEINDYDVLKRFYIYVGDFDRFLSKHEGMILYKPYNTET